MEQYKIDQLTQYLQTMKIAEDATSRMKKYLKKEANKFTIYRDILYRYNTDNGIIRKVLNKKEAEEIMYAYHQHPLGGHLCFAKYEIEDKNYKKTIVVKLKIIYDFINKKY